MYTLIMKAAIGNGTRCGRQHIAQSNPFHPKIGSVLMCTFGGDFSPPEMTKTRPVVILTPRRRASDSLYTVIPLSQTAPNNIAEYHHRLDPRSLPVHMRTRATFAKCDVIMTIAAARLYRVRAGDIFYSQKVIAADLDAIFQGVAKALRLVPAVSYTRINTPPNHMCTDTRFSPPRL